MTSFIREQNRAVSSVELSAAIGEIDFSGFGATVVGYGNMGREYVGALRALGVRSIRVCSPPSRALKELKAVDGIEVVVGGFQDLRVTPRHHEIGIVALPMNLLAVAAEKLAALDFPLLLIEKPVSLWSEEIDRLAENLDQRGVEAFCAYNRVAYPSLHELAFRASREGGITSCTYTVTERIQASWMDRFPPEELARWGIANSLHVMSLAHGLIGFPRTWNCHRSGSLPWHPSGAVFVGSGVSERGIPFAYHADWGSTGRWSVEAHTPEASYRLCPIEKVFRKASATADWEEIPLAVFAPEVKAGFIEETAAALNRDIRRRVPLLSLYQAASLARYGEDVFGYGRNRH